MSSTITVSVKDLLRASDVLIAAFKGDRSQARTHKSGGYPVTMWPGPAEAVTLAVQLSGGVVQVVLPATHEGDRFDEFTFTLANVIAARGNLGRDSVAIVLDGDRVTFHASGLGIESRKLDWPPAKVAGWGSGAATREAVFTFLTTPLAWVAKATADDDGRPVLEMVHAAPAKGAGVELAGMDGFRIHTAHAGGYVGAWSTEAATWKGRPDVVSLPSWLVAAIIKSGAAMASVAAGWVEEDGGATRNGANALFDAGGLEVSAVWHGWPLAPDYIKIMTSVPDDAEPVTGSMVELYRCLADVKPIARESADIFRVTGEDGALAIEASSVGLGTIRRRVAVTGQGFPFAAAVRYWLDALGKPANGAQFAIAMNRDMLTGNGALTPIRLVADMPWGPVTAIIMPMHIAR
jgi:hypothetical protein